MRSRNQEPSGSHLTSDFGLLSVLACALLAAGCPSKAPQDANARNGNTSTVKPQTSNASATSVAYYGYRVIREYPHDPCAFTQGLAYGDGFLYEGTGLYGQSKLIKRDFKTWQVVKQIDLPGLYFGEGITLVGDRIIQLTWQEHTGFVYDKNTLAQTGQFTLATEGWGLTYDGRHLILSDGSNTLSLLDPNTFAQAGQIRVAERHRPIRLLNELEYIPGTAAVAGYVPPRDSEGRAVAGAGSIYANILGATSIVILAPQTGAVTGWINLAGLYTPPADGEGNFVLNGIAYLPESTHLLITGKCWTKMFEIELVPQSRH
jgi:glutamine cyclotransferase